MLGINEQFSVGVKMNEGFGKLVNQMTTVFGDDDTEPDIDTLIKLSEKL